MRTLREIYAQYKIMPNLQLHQLRVAAVGKMICEDLNPPSGRPLDKNGVITACLFHDMGNILKFNLGYFPEFTKAEGREYWEKEKTEFKKKYGTDQHEASKKIANEIGLSETIIGYIDAVGFSKTGEALAGDSWEKKICEYSDMRIGPHGVLSLEERIMDGRKRYLARGAVDEAGIAAARDKFAALLKLSLELEKQIFAFSKIKPEDITDASIHETIKELWNYSVAQDQ